MGTPRRFQLFSSCAPNHCCLYRSGNNRLQSVRNLFRITHSPENEINDWLYNRSFVNTVKEILKMHVRHVDNDSSFSFCTEAWFTLCLFILGMTVNEPIYKVYDTCIPFKHWLMKSIHTLVYFSQYIEFPKRRECEKNYYQNYKNSYSSTLKTYGQAISLHLFAIYRWDKVKMWQILYVTILDFNKENNETVYFCPNHCIKIFGWSLQSH